MWLQRVHSEFARRRRRGEQVTIEQLDVPENRRWYPFQVAFMLVTLESATEPTHADRSHPVDAIVDLLWFPTGGGKTEAYLGLAAYAMALRQIGRASCWASVCQSGQVSGVAVHLQKQKNNHPN